MTHGPRVAVNVVPGSPRCGDCRFFDETEPIRRRFEDEPEIMGFCRRQAPTFHGGSPYARWPEVRAAKDWCGEFVDRVDDPSAAAAKAQGRHPTPGPM